MASVFPDGFGTKGKLITMDVARFEGLAFEEIVNGEGTKQVHIHFIAVLTLESAQMHKVKFGFVSIYQLGKSQNVHAMAAHYLAVFNGRCSNLFYFRSHLMDMHIAIRQTSVRFPRLDPIVHSVQGSIKHKSFH